MSREFRGLIASSAVRDALGDKVLKAERLGRHLPYIAAVRDNVILTRQGDLMASVTLGGIDSFTSDDARIDEISEGFARIVSQLGERFGFHINKVSRPDVADLAAPDGMPFANAVDAAWQRSLRARDLKARTLMLTVLMRPSMPQAFSKVLGALGGGRDFQKDIDTRIVALEEAMTLLMAMYSDAGAARLTVSSGDWLAVLAAVHGQRYGKIIAAPGQLLADTMSNFDVSFQGKTMRLESGGSPRYGAIFGMKSYPSRTWPTMLDALELPYDITITNSFTPRRANEMVERIQRTFRQRGASEDAGVSLTEQLIEAADAVASGRSTFGTHHASVQVFCDSAEELEQAASEIWRAGQETGAVLVRESWAAKALYFAQAPGNWAYRIRDGIVSSHNFAELAAFHKTRPGRGPEASPWGKTITAFPTVTSSLYRFNFHEAGRRTDEPSVGHTLVLGRTGSGKTLGTAFLMAQARRVGARVIVFDKDQGLEMAIRALGGSYSEIKVGKPTGFNPMTTETDARGAAWLTDWLGDILARHRPFETVQTAALNEAVRQIAAAEPGLRTFDGLASLVASTDDDGDLVSRVREWTEAGRYGWLFSRPSAQSIAIGEDVLGLDMTELLDQDAERSALLAYLFRRIERVIEDRRPTIIVIDEAWKMLADDIFVKRLHDWLVTMRKRNCVVMMLTQTPGHLDQSSVGQIIAESVATQILFPNPRANPEDYSILRLNAREADFLSSPTAGLRLALIRSGADSVFVNTDLAGLGGLVTVLGGGKTGEEKAPANWRKKEEFWKDMM
ncbi:type IV secretion system protein B4 [Phaeobacter sp. JH85H1]|uniref:VirB4 family type IV secretion/conjugal transfer ATPase n=1 Tax=unclassified Phaeobacter TaxID=2621772 RepID=UPI003A851701